jgi:outer membrane protein assembly factor BamB
MRVSSFRTSVALAAVAGAGVVSVLVLRDVPTSAHAEAAPATTTAPANGVAMFGHDPSRNMVNLSEKNLPDDWDVQSKKNILWSAKLGSRAYGGPTIADGKVFVGTNNQAPRNPRDARKRKDGKLEPLDKSVLMCFDAKTGKFLWQHVNDKLPSGQVHDWPEEGICSGPAVEGNRLYYVSNRCEVVCLDTNGLADGNQGVTDEQYKDPTDADVIWRLDMMKELAVFPHNLAACSPLLVGDTVWVVTANGVDEGHENIPAPDAPSFIAVDKHSGKVKWKSNAPGRNIMHGQWSNPTWAVVNGKPQVIFPGGDGWLRAFDPNTGSEIWKFDANPKTSVYKLGGKGTRSDFVATPVVVGDRMYIGTGQDPEHVDGVGHLWCVDITKTGDISPDLVANEKDNPEPEKRKTKPNPNSGAVWHYGGFEKDPNAAGRDFVFGRTISTCAVHDGLCYACDLVGFFTCLDAKTGQKLWQYDLKSEIWGSPYYVDGKVMIGTSDGDVVIFKAGKEKSEPTKVDMGKAIKSTPVATDGVLYVMTETMLYAIGKK